MSDKQRKVFKIIIICLAIFLIAELIYFGIRYYINRQNSTYYSVVNDIVLTDKGYVGAGFSDYKNSKFNDYADGYNKATIFVYKNDKQIDEISLDVGNNSYFNDIIKVSDGYVAVGSVEMTDDQSDEKLSEGVIVKYDEDFNIVWRKNVSILGKTELLQVAIDDNNDLIIVGTSVYGEGYVGNHTTGGGILLKYTMDGEEEFTVNNGGPYNGRFNDVLIEDDGYVVVGLGKSNSGVIIKYDENGEQLWSSSYGYTDEKGINAISKLDDNYITATTKVIDKDDLSNYQAAIVVFDENGEKLEDIKYSSDNITSFNDIAVDSEGNVFTCGYTGKLDSNNQLVSNAIVLKYDKDLYKDSEDIIKGEKSDFYTRIYLDDKEVYLLGYSNSDLNSNFNGYDYFPMVKKYNSSLK